MHVDKVPFRPIFIQIVDVLDFHLKCQRFEASTLESSDMIISLTVPDGTHVAIANTDFKGCQEWRWTTIRQDVARC